MTALIMAIVTDQTNCGEGGVGTWFDGCKVIPKDFTKLFLLAPSVNIDLNDDTFDEATRSELIKRNQLIALNDPLQIADTPAANNFQTFPNKVQVEISQGLYMFTVDFEANVCLVRALHRLKKKKWTLLLLDSEGKLFFDSRGGKLRGFDIQLFSVANETVNDGGSKIAMVQVMIQLSQRGTIGYNESKSFLLSDEENDFTNINGIQDVKILDVTHTAADWVVDVVSGCDGTSPVSGLTLANFQVVSGTTGLPVVVTITEIGNGRYKIGGAGASAGAKTVELYDTALSLPVADIDQVQFYASPVKLAVTVTA